MIGKKEIKSMKTHFAKQSHFARRASRRSPVSSDEDGQFEQMIPISLCFTKRTQNLWSRVSLLWSIYQTNPNHEFLY
jgi:hypothetical protein